MFRLSRFLNKYTVRNKLTSKVSETDLHPNGTIVGCGCDNKVNDDDSGKLQPQNAH